VGQLSLDHILISLASKPILILFSHLRLGLPNGPFPSCFWTKILCSVFIFPMHSTYPIVSLLLNRLNIIWWRLQITKLLIVRSSQPPVTLLVFPSSQTPSIYVLPLVWETKFHGHMEHTIYTLLPGIHNGIHYFLLFTQVSTSKRSWLSVCPRKNESDTPKRRRGCVTPPCWKCNWIFSL
jgi:hypothetical protein